MWSLNRPLPGLPSFTGPCRASPRAWGVAQAWSVASGLGENTEALFSSEKILDFGTVALSFVCDKYYPIVD